MRELTVVCTMTLATMALSAQKPQPPVYAPSVQVVEARGGELQGALQANDEASIEPARKAFDAAVADLLARKELLPIDNYHRAATVAWAIGQHESCRRIALFGMERFSEPGMLREFLGLANIELAQGVDTDAEMRRLLREACDALALWCKEKPNSGGPPRLSAALAMLGEWQEALAWHEKIAVQPNFERWLPPPYFVGIMQVGAERWDDAVKTLTTPSVVEGQDASNVAVLVCRAEAMNGQVDAAVTRARANFDRGATDNSVAALADVLAFAGKHRDALKLLAEHPVKERSDDARIQAGIDKSRATLRFLIGLEGKRPADLRQQLTKHLQHRFLVVGAAPSKGPAIGDSPWAIASTIRRAPSGPSSWANDLLFAVCVRDAAKYTQPKAEKDLLGATLDEPTRLAIAGPNAWKDAVRDVKTHIVLEDHPGALVVRRLIDKL